MEYRWFVVWQGGNHFGPFMRAENCQTLFKAYRRCGAKIVEARYEEDGPPGSPIQLVDRQGVRLA